MTNLALQLSGVFKTGDVSWAKLHQADVFYFVVGGGIDDGSITDSRQTTEILVMRHIL